MQAWGEISKNTFFHRTPSVAASAVSSLRYLSFCPDFYGHERNRLDKKGTVGFHCLCFLRSWATCVLQLLVSQTVISFEINISFPTKQFSYMTKKSGRKFKYPKNLKNFISLTWNKKHFSSFLKCFHLPQIVSDPRVGF